MKKSEVPVFKHDEAHGEVTHLHPDPVSGGSVHNHVKGIHGWFANRELERLPDDREALKAVRAI